MPRHTIVLDLDETLLHTEVYDQGVIKEFGRKPDYRLEENNMVGWMRPHLKEFLAYLFDHFQVIVWTAGNEQYAEAVVPKVFKANGLPMPERVFTGKDCVPRMVNTGWYKYEKSTYKPLPKLWKRGLSRPGTLIVDDRADIASDNLENLILIPAFLHDDEYLKVLREWLQANKVHERKDLAALDKTHWWLD
jgi:hypothetical protein